MNAKDKYIEKLEELIPRLNRMAEYLLAIIEHGKDDDFEEVMDVKLGIIKRLESELANLKQQIEAEEKTNRDEIEDLIFRYTLLLKYTSNSKKISDLLTDFMLRIK